MLKVIKYTIGVTVFSYIGWHVLSSKAENLCDNYKPRIDSIRKSLIKLEAKMNILNSSIHGNCYSSNKILYDLQTKNKMNLLTKEEISEYLIFDELLNEIVANKNLLKQDMQSVFELSKSYKNDLIAYECFSLDHHVQKGEREIEMLTSEFNELIFDNYSRFCKSSPFSPWQIQKNEIELGIND